MKRWISKLKKSEEKKRHKKERSQGRKVQKENKREQRVTIKVGSKAGRGSKKKQERRCK
jgi:hypothetical protein